MVKTKKSQRERIRRRVRSKVAGTAERPRLSVFKSSKHIYAQLIDDDTASTLAHVSSLSKDLADAVKGKTRMETATEVGKKIAELAKENKITTCVFDRSGYRYHGIVKQIADGAREGGLKF
jgi:large subunit ribosomal protein L18